MSSKKKLIFIRNFAAHFRSCFDVFLTYYGFWNLIYIFCVFFSLLIKCRPDIQSMNSYVLCQLIPSFIRKGTNLKCDIEKEKMAILYRGSKVAATECRYQFRMRPWNCSAAFESEPRIIYHRKSIIYHRSKLKQFKSYII